MTDVYLGLGSNLGDRRANLRRAVTLIGERVGRVTALSSFYETAPWGFASDNAFLNACLLVQTDYSPMEVLRITQRIERDMGRLCKSCGVYADRIIDIDILLFGDLVISTDVLTVPHPLMAQRDFVMRPLREIGGVVASDEHNAK